MSLDPDDVLDASKYWDFSHEEFGTNDISAMLDVIQFEDPCKRKVSYIGHSLGNTQIFSGLANNVENQDRFSQIVALTPCFVPSHKKWVDELDPKNYFTFFTVLSTLEINSLFGPYWDE